PRQRTEGTPSRRSTPAEPYPRRLCRGRRTGWCRGPTSLPEFLVHPVLGGEGRLQRGVLLPRPGHVGQVAPDHVLVAQAEPVCERLDRDLVEALSLGASTYSD